MKLELYRNGSTKPLITIEPDPEWPEMYRVVWPDGPPSQPLNLTRAKDRARRYFDEAYHYGILKTGAKPSVKEAYFWKSCPPAHFEAPKTVPDLPELPARPETAHTKNPKRGRGDD